MTDGLDSAKTPTRPPLPQADPPSSPPPAATDSVALARGASDETSAFQATVATGPLPTRPSGPRIPERLGPYPLLGELGRGGMGIVYRARHATLGTECAVKVLVAGEHASEESIVRFHRKAAGLMERVAGARYNLACACAQASIGVARAHVRPGEAPAPEEAAKLRDEAFACLEEAPRLGLDDVDAIEQDDDLAPLRTDPRWGALVDRLRKGGK